MSDKSAAEIAVELFAEPRLAARLAGQPLHRDVLSLIRIASGDHSSLGVFPEAIARDPDKCEKLAIFYIQQVMFTPEATPKRLLGLRPADDLTRVKEHKRWLLKWLHPDRNHNKWEQGYFQRVTEAAKKLEENPEPVERAEASVLRTFSGRKRSAVSGRYDPRRAAGDSPVLHGGKVLNMRRDFALKQQARPNVLPRARRRLHQLILVFGVVSVGAFLAKSYHQKSPDALEALVQSIKSLSARIQQ